MRDTLLQQTRDKCKNFLKKINDEKNKENFERIIKNYEVILSDYKNYEVNVKKIFDDYNTELYGLKGECERLRILNDNMLYNMKNHIDVSLTELKKLEIRSILEYTSFMFDEIYSYIHEDNSYSQYDFIFNFRIFLEELRKKIVCNGKLQDINRNYEEEEE